MKLLNTINSPADLKKLPCSVLEELAAELRDYIVQSVSKTGGHLSSNLGTVELAIALHYVFDTPADRLIWDVGHQSYAHKILTGRRDRMKTLRQLDGMSGFPKREESEYDSFGTGPFVDIHLRSTWHGSGREAEKRKLYFDCSNRRRGHYRRNGIRGHEQCRNI